MKIINLSNQRFGKNAMVASAAGCCCCCNCNCGGDESSTTTVIVAERATISSL